MVAILSILAIHVVIKFIGEARRSDWRKEHV